VRIIGRADREVLKALHNLGFGFYYPKLLEMRRVPKRALSAAQRRAGIEIVAPQLVPLFPGSTFVRFDMGRHGWREAFGIAGVGGLVCEGNLPMRVTERVLEHVKRLETKGAILARTETMRTVFDIGDRVVVNSGPFAEQHGVMQTALDVPFDEVDPAMRVKVALNLFGRVVSVELDIWQVVAV
jgi:transcription antitermination factor NusG